MKGMALMFWYCGFFFTLGVFQGIAVKTPLRIPGVGDGLGIVVLSVISIPMWPYFLGVIVGNIIQATNFVWGQ